MAMGYIDLHLHTTASDGVLHPSEIVRYAKGKELQAIAITDHDTVDGCEEGLLEGEKIGFEVMVMVQTNGISLLLLYLRDQQVQTFRFFLRDSFSTRS